GLPLALPRPGRASAADPVHGQPAEVPARPGRAGAALGQRVGRAVAELRPARGRAAQRGGGNAACLVNGVQMSASGLINDDGGGRCTGTTRSGWSGWPRSTRTPACTTTTAPARTTPTPT